MQIFEDTSFTFKTLNNPEKLRDLALVIAV
jgi:hypothetical protein